MTNNTGAARQIIVEQIGQQFDGKFTPSELTSLRSTEQLIEGVMAKFNCDHGAAQAKVNQLWDGLLNARA